MKYTENYKFKKPDPTDTVNIKDFNDTFDLVDKKLKETQDKNTNLDETFKQLVINAGDSNAEIVLSRRDKVANKTHNSLPDRLDEVSSQLQHIAYQVKSFGAIGDGIADDTIAIQNAITSAGTGKTVIFEELKSYKVSSTIFVPVGVILEFNFATITPIAGGTFINNFVFSFNSSDVSTWDSQYPFKFVEVRHLVSDNINNIVNLKLIFTACPIRTKDCYSRRYYGTVRTPYLYIDLFEIDYFMIVDHMSSTNYGIEKFGQGDSVLIKGVHCVNYSDNAFLKGVSISGTRGCTIEGCINGDYKINDCETLSINNGHFEKGKIIIQDSSVEFNGGYFWKIPTDSCIKIIDTQLQYSEQINRPVTLNNIVFKLRYADFEYNTDFEEIDISEYVGALVLNNVFRECEIRGMPYAHAYNCGITLKTGIDTYISTNSNLVTVKNKTIKNDKIINGTNDDGYYYMLASVVHKNNVVNFKASLTTYYYKVASILDKSRMIGIVNSANEKSVVINNLNSHARLLFANNVMHLPMIRIYRGTTTKVYDKYVDIPYPMSKALFDTGEDVNGFIWKTNVSNTYDVLNTTYSFQFNGVNITTHGIAIPTVGTWLKGDRVINTSPSAGGYSGWICITAGTPGTWKGFGLIQD